MHALPLTEPVAVFTVVLLVLLAAPLVARRGVPSAVVLLAAGVVLGPHALGVLDRDPTMVLLGTVGLLYIMFLAGLEIDLHELREGKERSLGFGAATFLLPQLVGVAVGVLVLGMGWPAAVLLGSVFASHTLLAYPAAARLGLQKERATTTAVGATILTDTLALLVLAVVATGAREGGGFDVLVFVRVGGALLVVGGVVLWGLSKLGAWFFRTAAQDATVEFVFVLAAVFVCALGVEALGVEPIIGAFLAGLGLNRLVPEGGPLMNRIGFFGNALFVPFFLLSTGMLVDLGAFTEAGAARAWTVALAMTATLLMTKGAAALLLRPVFGFSADEVRLAFGLTVPQAAATLAAVLVGVEVGLFDGAVLNGTIAMVFVTCVVGPVVVERAGRRLAQAAAERAPDARDVRDRVLVSLANPATAEALVDLALLARGPEAAAPLAAVTVVPGGPGQAAAVAAGERTLSAAVVHAAGAEVPVLPLVRVESNVARALARAAAETRASLLVMGWDGSAAAERVLFGSVPDRVLRETPTAVLIARETRPAATLGRLLVAVPPLAELEPGFGAAAGALLGLAARAGAEVVVLTPAPYADAVRGAFGRARRSGPAPEVRPLDRWADLPGTLAGLLRPTDALALVSARQGALAWRASLDRLPRVLARRHPGLTLFVLFPGQVPVSPILPSGLTSSDRAFLDRLRPEAVRLGLTPDDPAGLFRQTLGEAFPPDVARRLADAPPDARPEVRPGVVLSHVRSALADEPALGVGVSRDGVAMPGASGPVHVVLALVVPERVPSRRYLGWLSLVARMLRDDATVEALRHAETPERAHAVLLGALRGDAETGP
jgi:Kef-type K+ transport system membrane component KefB